MKTDQSIKQIVVAAIRRKSMNMATWTATRLCDDGDSSHLAVLSRSCELAAGELPILYSYIDELNWTLVSTRRIISSVAGEVESVFGSRVVTHWWGNFKGDGDQEVALATLGLGGDEEHHCLFETGEPSMGTIYAIKTMCQLTRRDRHQDDGPGLVH